MLNLTTRRADMCFCPGCSHGMVLEHIGQVLDRMGRKPQDVCIVSDIGCIGTADRYFACHTFHGLHGRSITYAEGIKRTRPDLLVIVLIGDGGCGIGTGHLVHAARRGVDINVIVCNNFNFGMTGGQHSPTTPLGGLTSTTPAGAVERPFDICATVAANGAAFVARQGVFDKEIGDRIESAFATRGFALVDVWELCTAYFVPANRINRKSLNDLSQRLALPFGVLQHQAQTDADPAMQREKHPVAIRPGPVPRLPDIRIHVPARSEICVAGSAGQRIRSAVGVIGELMVAAGLHAAQQDDYPITVRKGFSISHLTISPAAIRYAGVDSPDLVLILSQDGLERSRSTMSNLRDSSMVVIDIRLECPPLTARVVRIDFARLEKECGKASAALAALTHAGRCAGLIQADELLRAADAVLSGPYRTANLHALAVGIASFNPAQDPLTPATPGELQ